jgi:predicted ATPase/DNA-binding SARP family transcriptional activator
VEFGILGPLTVWQDGREVELGAAKQRALLAVLLLHAGETMATERLVDALWDEKPPATAVKALQVYISQLRKALGEGVVETRPLGYVLRCGEDALDLQRFERLLEEGRRQLGGGSAQDAGQTLREAIALWRGAPLADFRYEAFAQNEIGRLEELRLVAIGLRVEADLALGLAAEVVPELEALVREHPLRERLRELLILALYRAGRQADALAAYQDARTALVDELGLDPGEGLQQLEKAILVHDPSLDVAVATSTPDGLPTGTVTFLFTDVEGSTAVLARIGSVAYATLLDEHRSLLRSVFAGAGGHEVDTQGDAFFFAFRSAADAIRAAVQAERETSATEMPIRIGIHTGEPIIGPTGYVDLDVPRAARICAAGHGGQVLISQSTRQLIEDDLGEGIALRDLGEHRLRGLERPERLSQLVIPGLRNEFPALRTLESRPTNLPAQLTPLIGREREVAEVAERLRRENLRLLTLCGPGGTGKTRLALQAAAELVDDFPQGVFLVALAPLTDPALVLPSIAQTLGLKESGAIPIVEMLGHYLAEKRVLLLLDNFEHLIEAAPFVSELLTAAPDLRILATSRSPLELTGEHQYTVTPLSREEAVKLFTERAAAVEADVRQAPEVERICQQLDCLPLAIELAAARARTLPPDVMLPRLEQQLELLTGGPRDRPERQRTLRGAIEWSYGLLDADEQRSFVQLAVFAGGCTLKSAERVCGVSLETLESLTEESLLYQRDDRFMMLLTIREYARERLLASGEADSIMRRLAELLREEADAFAAERARGQPTPLSRLEDELENIRVAIQAALTWEDDPLALQLAVALTSFWRFSGRQAEGLRWTVLALEQTTALSTPVRAGGLRAAGVLATLAAYVEQGRAFGEEALALYRADGDELGAADVLPWLATAHQQGGDPDRARVLREESLALQERLGSPIHSTRALRFAAEDELGMGNGARASELFHEALEIARSTELEGEVVMALHGLGDVCLVRGETAEAAGFYVEALRASVDETPTAHCLAGLAAVAALEQHIEVAGRVWGAVEAHQREMGERLMLPQTQDRYEAAFAQVEEAPFAAAVVAGHEFTIEEATLEALNVFGDPLPTNVAAD